MWMGDYPELPAKVLETGEDLGEVLKKNQETLLGQQSVRKFGPVLPFLPKILSIAKALPLQIHPNKDLAARLHKENPEQFTDDNHKPEIAIALGPFEVFAGWKPTEDIKALFNHLDPLTKFLPKEDSLVPNKNIIFNDETVRTITKNILEASDETIAQTQNELAKVPREELGKQAYILDLLPRLQLQYSKEDPGNLVALLCMSFLKLDAGQAIYVPADAPHAYLSGDIVECMARSNNVLNTGFCPRADRDNIQVFTSAMTFKPHRIDEALLPSTQTNRSKEGKSDLYAPPLSEFNMLRTRLGRGETETISAAKGPSVLFVTGGDGNLAADGQKWDLKEGYVFFVGPETEVSYESKEGLEVYMASAE